MKTLTGMLAIGLMVALGSPGDVIAQQAPPQQPGILEAFSCTFTDGNDLDDFLAVAERWNDWADERNVTNYTAIVLTPYLYSNELTSEVIWLGVWPEGGAAMGAGEAQWLAEGREVDAAFQEVSECSAHQLAAALPIRVPEGGPTDAGLISFRDCTIAEGHTPQQALGAVGRLSAYFTENGNDLFQGVLFPLAGETSDAGYDFKLATGFASQQAFGQFLDSAMTPEALQAGANIMGGLMTCDSPRIYLTHVVRVAETE